MRKTSGRWSACVRELWMTVAAFQTRRVGYVQLLDDATLSLVLYRHDIEPGQYAGCRFRTGAFRGCPRNRTGRKNGVGMSGSTTIRRVGGQTKSEVVRMISVPGMTPHEDLSESMQTTHDRDRPRLMLISLQNAPSELTPVVIRWVSRAI